MAEEHTEHEHEHSGHENHTSGGHDSHTGGSKKGLGAWLESHVWYLLGGAIGVAAVVYFFFFRNAGSGTPNSQTAATLPLSGGGSAGGSSPSSATGTDASGSGSGTGSTGVNSLSSEINALSAMEGNLSSEYATLSNQLTSLQSSSSSSTGTSSTGTSSTTPAVHESNGFIHVGPHATPAERLQATLQSVKTGKPISYGSGFTGGQVGYIASVVRHHGGALKGITDTGVPILNTNAPWAQQLAMLQNSKSASIEGASPAEAAYIQNMARKGRLAGIRNGKAVLKPGVPPHKVG